MNPLQVRAEAEAQRKVLEAVRRLRTDAGRAVALQIVREFMTSGSSPTWEQLAAPEGFKRRPVSMSQFLKDPFYAGGVGNIRKVIYDDLVDLFDGGYYVEAVIDGAIGWGKSTFVSLAFAYMLYWISCLENPQEYFGVMPGSAIYLVNQSVNKALAKKVVFEEVRARIQSIPYFQKYYSPNPEITSELQFPNRVIVMPLAAEDTSALGLNVFGGCLDEVNFMRVVKDSKRARSINEVFDTPQRLYNTISRRLRSRFMQAGGYVPGKIMIVSSSQYFDDFTERKKRQARTDPTVFVRSHSLWEARGEENYSGEYFEVELGGEHGRSRILTGAEELVTGEVIRVPVEYRKDFEDDLEGAIRDIAGRPTIAITPFIPDVTVVDRAVDPNRMHPFSGEDTTLNDGVRLIPELLADRIDDDRWRPKWWPEAPRFGHIDYALTTDECGVAMGCVAGERVVERRQADGEVVREKRPLIWIDLMLRIVAPRGGEIDFEAVRSVLLAVRKYGFKLRTVTADSYQSMEAQQQLRKLGIESKTLSVDTDLTPYNELKLALMDGRLSVYEYAPFRREIATLEIDRVRKRVDHAPHSDKGVTDAVAGVVMNCIESVYKKSELFFI